MTGRVSDDAVIVVDRADGRPGDETPVGFGLERLYSALESRAPVEIVSRRAGVDADRLVVVGRTDDEAVERLLDAAVETPESVVFQRVDTDEGTATVVAGTDDRGLLYALLELADRVEADGIEALDDVEDLVETPDNAVRGVDRYVMGPTEDEWLFDDEFWHDHLRMLARCRYNRFALIVGFDTAFMSPPYPFLVDVPGYPDVRLSDVLDGTREAYRERIRTIGRLCERYGLEFVLGIWQQRPWSANPDFDVDIPDQGSLVEGVPEDADAFADYCADGFRELLVACPEVDVAQLRVNMESGVGDLSTAEAFWEGIIDAAAEASAERTDDVKLDLRAKGLTDGLIEHALSTGLDVTVPTKFSWESTGLAYHTTRLRAHERADLDDMNRSRRYSYADLLARPRSYDVLYRLWMVGTNRLFLWGDPDYARRFSAAAGFGDGVGFEVAAPLSLKGGHHFVQAENWPLHADPDLRHYEYEDERYWAWYLLFGRLGYSRETDPEVWRREFRARFGGAADAVIDGYRAASRILPLLTSAHLVHHPALCNWAELDTGGALFAENNYNGLWTPTGRAGPRTYGSAEPGDPGVFYGVDEFVTAILDGDLDGRYTPPQVARWFEEFSERARGAVDRAEAHGADGAEFAATQVDLRMLADLGAYHAEKTRAAVELAAYRETELGGHVRNALEHMATATDAWAALAERGEAFHDDLRFGQGPENFDAGHWADRVGEMEADLAELERLVDESGNDGPVAEPIGDDARLEPPSVEVSVPDAHPAGEDLVIETRLGEGASVGGPWLRYRRANQLEGAFRSVRMDAIDGGYRGVIPGEYVSAEYDLLAYVSWTDGANGFVLPGLYHPTEPAPYWVIETRAPRFAGGNEADRSQ